MKSEKVKRLKSLENENQWPKEFVADLILDNRRLGHLWEGSW
jgi:hypothetical protein